MAQGATISSIVHERAWRGMQEAEEKQARRQEAAQRADGSIRKRQEAMGALLLDMPDAN